MDLTIDGKQIRTNAFVEKILTNISWGIINSLKDVPDNPRTIRIVLAKESDLEISLDGQAIRTNPFVQKTVHNIITGTVNSLDDIPANPENIILSISEK
jgi:hypothetical protein